MTTIPNFKLLKNQNRVLLIKYLDRFQDNSKFSIFEHMLNLKPRGWKRHMCVSVPKECV